MSKAEDTDDLSEEESSFCPEKHIIKAKFDMNDGLIALFEDFMLRNEYEYALNVICDCWNISPTSFVISEVIFKIMRTCDFKLCSKALDYLEKSLKLMPTDDNHKYVFIEGLKEKSGGLGDAWDAFCLFVMSSLHERKILDGFISLQEYVKYPNCDYLVQIYVHAFLKGPFENAVFVSHPEEKLSTLVKWINAFYKHNAELDDVLKNLHLLLDHIFELELSNFPEIPKCAAIYKASISKYILILLNGCTDVFHLENQQRFFILTESPHLILKICQQRLDDMLVNGSVPQNSILTLKSIVENYFFDQREQKISNQASMKEGKTPKTLKGRQKKQPPIRKRLLDRLKPGKKHKGDTDFHLCCRSKRFDNLLEALYADRTKDINVKNCIGMTPLHEACLVDSYLCCKFLIEDADVRRVDFRATDNEGRIPLHFAAFKNSLDIVNLLIRRGGSDLVKYCDNEGKKPIDYCESEEVRKVLQNTESQLELSDEESKKNSDSVQQKPPKLKISENLPLYLRTLRSLIGNYCEVYDIPKDEYDGKVELLSHSDEECYHFKAPSKGTLCLEDSSSLTTIVENIKKLSACIKLVSTDVNMKRELRRLDILASTFA